LKDFSAIQSKLSLCRFPYAVQKTCEPFRQSCALPSILCARANCTFRSRSVTSAKRSLINSLAIKSRADVRSEAVQNGENKPELRVSAENIALIYYTGFGLRLLGTLASLALRVPRLKQHSAAVPRLTGLVSVSLQDVEAALSLRNRGDRRALAQ
jgi:hypothetical protein